mgnify:FL=1
MIALAIACVVGGVSAGYAFGLHRMLRMSEDLRKAEHLVDYYQNWELLALTDKERYEKTEKRLNDRIKELEEQVSSYDTSLSMVLDEVGK